MSRADPREVQPQTARENRLQDTLRLVRQEDEHRIRRRFFQRLEESIRRVHVQPVRARDDRHLEGRLRGLEINCRQQLPHLLHLDHARLRFRAQPQHIGMQVRVHLAATPARLTAIQRQTLGIPARGLLAAQHLGQRARHHLQFTQVPAVEEIRVAQTPALQAALKQRHRVLLLWEIPEGHRARAGYIPGCCCCCFVIKRTSKGMLRSCRPSTAMSTE